MGGVDRFQLLPTQGDVYSNRRETDPGTGDGARSKYSAGWVSENRCRAGLAAKARNMITPHACASEREHKRKMVETIGIATAGQ